MLGLQSWEGRLGKRQYERPIFFLSALWNTSLLPSASLPLAEDRCHMQCHFGHCHFLQSCMLALGSPTQLLASFQASIALCPTEQGGHHLQVWIQVILKWIGGPKFHTWKTNGFFFSPQKSVFPENSKKVVWSLLGTSRINDFRQKRSLV